MVAWLVPSANIDIYAGGADPAIYCRADQEMVHSQTGTAIVAASISEIPISVDTLLGVNCSTASTQPRWSISAYARRISGKKTASLRQRLGTTASCGVGTTL